MSAPRKRAELAKIEQAITVQEGLRGVLTDEQVEAALRPLLEKRAALQAEVACRRVREAWWPGGTSCRAR
jgi:hypothetical protein